MSETNFVQFCQKWKNASFIFRNAVLRIGGVEKTVYHFAIILNSQDIIYCSSASFLPKFEIAQFTNLLIEQLDSDNNWTLHKILLKSLEEEQTMKLLIRQKYDKTTKTKIQFCILSDLGTGSAYGYQLLDRFFDHFLKEYPAETIASNLDEEKREEIKALGNLLFSTMFGSSYENMIKQISQSECFPETNKILYMGLSTHDGVPILSKIFKEGAQILNAKDENRMSYLNTVLSGQLATISMNAFIRANTELISIQVITDDPDYKYIFFDFARLGVDKSYVFEVISTGNPDYIINLKNEIADILDSFNVLQNPFMGQIKNYIPLIDVFEEYYAR